MFNLKNVHFAGFVSIYHLSVSCDLSFLVCNRYLDFVCELNLNCYLKK